MQRAATLALTALALIVAGCGGDDEKTVTVDAPATQSTPAQTDDSSGGGQATPGLDTETENDGGAVAPGGDGQDTAGGDNSGGASPGGGNNTSGGAQAGDE